VCQRGQFCEFDKNRAHQDLTGRVSLVRVELGRGPACVTFYGTDLTDDYVHINAEYST
jgi:N-acetylglutamate synthase/N-acetylornithine aminotransferase